MRRQDISKKDEDLKREVVQDKTLTNKQYSDYYCIQLLNQDQISREFMLGKLAETASYLKAKIKRDELEEKLLEATSQENWQTSTNTLHEIANASYNYEKWQRINEFVWDKLKKKPTWRKVLKSLNIIEFLLKNGPPSILSPIKYENYHFKEFLTFHWEEDGLDRGESIRQKARLIVELITNDDYLEQERDKAKTIRQRMSNIVGGGTSYGAQNGYKTGRYQSYDSESYGKNNKFDTVDDPNSYDVYSDYYYSKSNIDKYKNKSQESRPKSVIDITGQDKPSLMPSESKSDSKSDDKKPFERIAPKLVKPSQKKVIVQNKSQKIQKKEINLIDEDILGFGSDPMPIAREVTPVQQKPVKQAQSQVLTTSAGPPGQYFIPQESKLPYEQPQTHQIQTGPRFDVSGNPIYTQTSPKIEQSHQSINSSGPPGQYFIPQEGKLPYNQPQMHQLQFGPRFDIYGHPVYNQPNIQVNPNYNQVNSMNYGYVHPGNQMHQHIINSNIPYGQFNYIPQNQVPLHIQNQYNPYQNYQPQIPPQYTQPVNLYQNLPSTISFSQPPKTQTKPPGSIPQNQEPKKVAESTNSSKNISWLDDKQKGLIDFSDFSKQAKQSPKKQKRNTDSNNIKIDMWNW